MDSYLQDLGYKRSLSEYTLYTKKVAGSIVVISLYVDDILVTGNDCKQINQLKHDLMQTFEMTDLGVMTYFLGMEIKQSPGEIFICQKKYLKEILRRFRMEECKSVGTPMNQKEKLQKEDGAEPTDNATYRSLVGCLMYLTATRPDIQYTVSVLLRFLHCASELHMKAAKRVLRYLKGTSSYGIKFTKSERFKLYGYSDSDWAGSVEDMKSTTSYCFAMGSVCFSWCSKKQDIVALSTAEAEFIAATAAANHAIWLRKLLTDLGFTVGETELNVDNQAALAISQNHVFHGKTKHFKVKFYYLREVQKSGEIKLVYCSTENQYADIFTKPFQVDRFEWLRKQIGVCSSI
ncbi:hypothetical protein K2173_020069 [Erythroxylum novogranatense]|uniref:Reverse transcriptase Ty1/copia-type domain-containing protein n=1 Tax=Erythroxylum novogranatense TaxID=1862640 RepID=A0AAV8UAS2_9ROSI|nr:hypothetical protein K2173_020069 [Erythroxylum novogranatense]